MFTLSRFVLECSLSPHFLQVSKICLRFVENIKTLQLEQLRCYGLFAKFRQPEKRVICLSNFEVAQAPKPTECAELSTLEMAAHMVGCPDVSSLEIDHRR